MTRSVNSKIRKGERPMKKKWLAGLVIASLIAGLSAVANATTLTSEISMDNGYVIYLSTSDSIAGTSFGSANDWYTTYTDSITLTAGVDYYLHVYGYDQGSIAGFLGEFTLSGTGHVFSNSTSSLLTNTTDWKGNTTGWGNAYLAALTDLGANGASPWGTRSGIPGTARWIWAGDANNNDCAYFSTKISAASVPLPASVLLLGPGLMGLAWVRRKFQR